MKVIIIGAGAAGLMAAYSAALYGHKVIILEKNEKAGKKIYITGKGRCNLTNYCDRDAFIKNVVSNPKFLFSSLERLDPYETVKLFNNIGLPTKVERGNRVFPVSDIASDVTFALERAIKKLGVSILYNSRVETIKKEDDVFLCYIEGKSEAVRGEACIIATGGLSYPSTGSTGDGYGFARKFGHMVTDTFPSLTGIRVKEDFPKDLEGLTLKNVSLKVISGGKEKDIGLGEILFTHNGVSGPLVLTASALYAKKLSSGENIKLKVDLKPALGYDVLDTSLVKDFSRESNKILKNILLERLPASIVPIVLKMSQTDGEKKACTITVQERKNIVRVMKNFEMTAAGSGSYLEAVVTQGGIKVSEVNPKTMESKFVKRLYFAGEVLDLDAFTGGYNLQIAWTTGYTAGLLK